MTRKIIGYTGWNRDPIYEKPKHPKRTIADKILDYEDGRLTKGQTVALFQELVDTGMAWTLQGAYGRTANLLIQAGLVKRNVKIENRLIAASAKANLK